MSITNFIPTVWSGNILFRLYKAYVFANLANRDYEGEIKNFGDVVKITQIGKVTVRDYTRNVDLVSPDELSDAQRELKIDQAKYFNFQVDDVDKAQVKPQLIQGASQEASMAMADVVDQYLAGLITDASLRPYLNAAVATNSLNIQDIIVEIGKQMDNNNIPKANRFMVVPPWFSAKLTTARLHQLTVDSSLYSTGFLTNALGFNFYQSNNVLNDGTNYQIAAGVLNKSYTFADQILELVAYRPEKRFADAMKGLHVYGGKLLRPDMTACVDLSEAAES